MPLFWEAVGILFVISFLWSLSSLRGLLRSKKERKGETRLAESRQEKKAEKGSVVYQSK